MRAFVRRLATDKDLQEWVIFWSAMLAIAVFAHLGWIGRGGAA